MGELQEKLSAPREVVNMAVWKLKSCPRCNGDLFIQRETDGWYEECLLCGYQHDVSNIVVASTDGQIKIKGQLADKRLYTNVRSNAN
jgi:Zn ribbon nucleic-acid-binding protein